MTVDIPVEMELFVQRMVAEQRFSSEGAVLTAGLRLLQAREELRKEIQKGADQLDAGQGIPADEVYARIHQRIDEVERQNAAK